MTGPTIATLADSTPAMLIRDYLLSADRADEFEGWEIKFGKIPAAPDQVIVLIDQGDRANLPHLLVDWVGLQVIVRSARAGDGYQSSWLMARKVRDVLLGCFSKPIEFRELNGIVERAYIAPMGYDENDRHLWSWNARMLVEPETNALTNRASL